MLEDLAGLADLRADEPELGHEAGVAQLAPVPRWFSLRTGGAFPGRILPTRGDLDKVDVKIAVFEIVFQRKLVPNNAEISQKLCTKTVLKSDVEKYAK